MFHEGSRDHVPRATKGLEMVRIREVSQNKPQISDRPVDKSCG